MTLLEVWPRLRLANGAEAGLRARDGVTYCILSAPRFSLAVRATREDLIVDTSSGPKLGFGNFFTSAMWTVHTDEASRRNGTEPLRVSVSATRSRTGFSLHDAHGIPLEVKRPDREHAVGDVRVWAINPDVVVVRGAGWETNVTTKPVYRPSALRKRGSKSFVNRSAHEFRAHVLDVSMRPLDGTELAPRHGCSRRWLFAPHGLLGQAWDAPAADLSAVWDVPESAQIDTRERSVALDAPSSSDTSDNLLVTNSPAEGALLPAPANAREARTKGFLVEMLATVDDGPWGIEGTLTDYELPSAFETRFRFSRFDSVEPPDGAAWAADAERRPSAERSMSARASTESIQDVADDPPQRIPRFPIGQNADPTVLKRMCPRGNWYRCLGAALAKHTSVKPLLGGSARQNSRARINGSLVGDPDSANSSFGELVTAAGRVVGCPFEAEGAAAAAAGAPWPRWQPLPASQRADAGTTGDADSFARSALDGGRPQERALQHRLAEAAAQAARSGARLTCDGPTALLNTRLLLLLGVPSHPAHGARQRRSAARESWMRDPAVGVSLGVCFLLSSRYGAVEMERLEPEASQHGDMIFLPADETSSRYGPTKKSGYAKKGRGMPTFKQFSFFAHAARRLPSVAFVGKLDDDSAINPPLMLGILSQLRCRDNVVVGAINWASLIPRAPDVGNRAERCGFGWTMYPALHNFGLTGLDAATPASCVDRGAVPPFPYPIGAAYIFSGPLLRWIATSQEVTGWVAAALQDEQHEALQWQKFEDSTTGYWLSYAPGGARFVDISKYMHDFACRPDGERARWHSQLYRPPANTTLVTHQLKRGGFRTTAMLMRTGAVYDHVACLRDRVG